MSATFSLTSSALRGSLKPSGPGARGLEQMARNPVCARLQVITVAGVSLAAAARGVYGEPVGEGQSPFAINAGNRFERQLLDGGGVKLFALYREHGRLDSAECRLVDVPTCAPGTNPADLARRRIVTEDLLRRKLDGDPAAPNVVVKPRLAIELLGEEYEIEPDLLVAADAEPFYRVVEVKSYADRDGTTDPSDLRGACRQAAVGVLVLRQTLGRLGIAAPADLVVARADLVLRKPGSTTPTLRPMTIEQELDSLERLLADLPRIWADVVQILAGFGPNATLVGLELPPLVTGEHDEEMADVMVALVERLLARGTSITECGATRPLAPSMIGVACAHVSQVNAVRERLPANLAAVFVETANRFQGLERSVMLAQHPLSGRAEASEFQLDAGRLCVMLSRHRFACFVAMRGGVDDMLARYAPSGERVLGIDRDSEHEGWRAHARVLHELRTRGHLISVP